MKNSHFKFKVGDHVKFIGGGDTYNITHRGDAAFGRKVDNKFVSEISPAYGIRNLENPGITQFVPERRLVKINQK